MTTKVLFVCLGNICRSPTAHGVFAKLVAEAGLSDSIIIDSAGTGDWHIGRAPDERTQKAAIKRGYDLSALRARQVCSADFDQYDYVLAMDKSNLKDIRAMAGNKTNCHVSLFLDFAESSWQREVPDPYYGGEDGFDTVLELVEDGARGLLAAIQYAESSAR
ncbi:Low molecular weight protein-tyrosine-phosphatase YfkJ [Zhongshania aliphaticivorans]|uniref:protein-tyrosine-phosphatase n=1 Tax=Zhongshania aliphaticivorans TaxID=1470434 RepID=A0A5S9QQR9_9GAMM|nr:low molecular weight protein-tyrosine-phosphatase [Zhongshania aliphaticivorans]CAA0088427.1 Low molecular weight protein-tyrosine-phosphatase YfkJ [Zhongshania aliphaticivorans]CAA0120514.1 Low molecular weight protein-tyrosine-phosphatase YfkJ [Zhongshania aliphaticivorans]